MNGKIESVLKYS